LIDYKILSLIVFCTLLGAAGQIFMKLGSSTFSFDLSMFTNWRLIVGAALYGTSAILFVYALKFTPLSLAYPLIALTYIWVPLVSVFFLQESFQAYKWAGIGLILLGVVIIAR
jgi:drug/metabolite transporter (DMT)-like permease